MYRTLPGIYIDALPDGGSVRVLPDTRTVACELAPEIDQWFVATTEVVRELKCAIAPDGEVRWVAKGGISGRLIRGDAFSWALTEIDVHGVDGAAIGHNGDHFVILAMLYFGQDDPRNGRQYRRIAMLPGGAVSPQDLEVPASVGATAFGVLSFVPGLNTDGSEDRIVWTDVARSLLIDGEAWRLSQTIDGGLVAQYGADDWIGGFRVDENDQLTRFTIIDAKAFAPRVCERNGRVTVVAPLVGGVCAVATAPPWPAWRPAEPAPVVAPLSSPCWAGYFWRTSDKYGDNPDAPGTCEFVDEPAAASRATLPTISPPGKGITPVVAYFLSGGDASSMQTLLNTPGLPTDRPVIAYVDNRAWSFIPTTLGLVLWYGVQAYCDPDESIDDFEARIVALIESFGSRKVALIAQAYDRNGSERDGAKLRALQAVWPRLLRRYPTICCLLWFSDGRPGGTRDHKDLRAWHRATLAAIPGVPIDAPPPPIPPRPTPPPPPPPNEDDPMLTDQERDPMLEHAGRIAAAIYGIPVQEAIQGCRQASDALRAQGSDGTPSDWILLSRARAGGATTGDVELVAADVARLRQRRAG